VLAFPYIPFPEHRLKLHHIRRNRYGGSSLTTFLTATSFTTMIPDEDLIFGDDNMGLVVVGFGVDEVTVVDELVGGGGRWCGGGVEDMRMR
nr:hypothetical protein [Tanacetum cinerariifolium]